jgi:nitrite reductase (NADH) small subunit
MTERRKVASTDDIAPGELRKVEIGGKKIVVYNVDGDFYATGGTCPHRGGPLGDGLLEGTVVTCPWHAWQFDVSDGRALYDEGFSLPCYPVIVEGGDILIEVES